MHTLVCMRFETHSLSWMAMHISVQVCTTDWSQVHIYMFTPGASAQHALYAILHCSAAALHMNPHRLRPYLHHVDC